MQQVAGAPKRKAGHVEDSGDEEEKRASKKVLISVPTFEVVLDKKPNIAKKTGTARPRGRPRKDAAVKSSPGAKSTTKLSPSNTPTESQPHIPKKRGRPPKVKNDISSPLPHMMLWNTNASEHKSPSESPSFSKTEAPQSTLFSIRKQDRNTKETTRSPPLFSKHKPAKDCTQSMNAFPGLFSRQKEDYESAKKMTALLTPPSAMFECPNVRVVQGTFVQNIKGHFTPAQGYPPLVVVHTNAYLGGGAEAARGIFSNIIDPNKASSKFNWELGSGINGLRGTSGGLFGERPPSSLFGPPSTGPDMTFKSLFGSQGVPVATDDPPSVRSIGGSDGRNLPFGTPGSAGIFGSMPSGGQPWSPNMPGLFKRSSTGLFSSEAAGNGSLFGAMQGSSGKVGIGVGVGESAKVGAFGTSPSATGLFGSGSSSGAGGGGGEANAAAGGETIMQRMFRTMDAQKAAERKKI